ncbi:MAG: AIR carboxylase family protein [Anaerolineae bacterium]|nr:AIR carboxylase family protein [Anaerolineae bacterium]
MNNGRVIIIMGSKSDLEHVNEISAQLDDWQIPYQRHVASAHKSVRHLLSILDEINGSEEPTVVIAVAGRSNALAGMIDANTHWPVITCPPVSSKFGGADIYSSLRMPSGVAPGVILSTSGAALAAAKALALQWPELREHVAAYQRALREKVMTDDADLQKRV